MLHPFGTHTLRRELLSQFPHMKSLSFYSHVNAPSHSTMRMHYPPPPCQDTILISPVKQLTLHRPMKSITPYPPHCEENAISTHCDGRLPTHHPCEQPSNSPPVNGPFYLHHPVKISHIHPPLSMATPNITPPVNNPSRPLM